MISVFIYGPNCSPISYLRLWVGGLRIDEVAYNYVLMRLSFLTRGSWGFVLNWSQSIGVISRLSSPGNSDGPMNKFKSEPTQYRALLCGNLMVRNYKVYTKQTEPRQKGWKGTIRLVTDDQWFQFSGNCRILFHGNINAFSLYSTYIPR